MNETESTRISRAMARAERAIEAAKSCAIGRETWQVDDVVLSCEGYAEPGYSGDLIAFGNWNGVNLSRTDAMPRLAAILERLGFQVEWSDEWARCSHCNKAVRTSPDSYGWTPSYIAGDGELSCSECALDDPAGLLESYEGREESALTLNVDPGEHGYFKPDALDGIDTGYHPGQDGDPRVVARALRKANVDRFLFVIDSVGQFDSRWSVWIHEDERDLYEAAFGEEDPETDGRSPSEGLRKALASIPERPAGDGVYVVTCDASTGTAAGRLVPQDEFIEGIKR